MAETHKRWLYKVEDAEKAVGMDGVQEMLNALGDLRKDLKPEHHRFFYCTFFDRQ
jgi:hypothetical protein